jgi:hypothetical protein
MVCLAWLCHIFLSSTPEIQGAALLCFSVGLVFGCLTRKSLAAPEKIFED